MDDSVSSKAAEQTAVNVSAAAIVTVETGYHVSIAVEVTIERAVPYAIVGNVGYGCPQVGWRTIQFIVFVEDILIENDVAG